MIYFDSKTGKFRDKETGRLRSDVSGLLSSRARREYKAFAGNIDVAEYRKKLGQKFYVAPTNEPQRKQAPTKTKTKTKRSRFEETDISNFDDYIGGWLDEYDFVLDEEDTDLETP